MKNNHTFAIVALTLLLSTIAIINTSKFKPQPSIVEERFDEFANLKSLIYNAKKEGCSNITVTVLCTKSNVVFMSMVYSNKIKQIPVVIELMN